MKEMMRSMKRKAPKDKIVHIIAWGKTSNGKTFCKKNIHDIKKEQDSALMNRDIFMTYAFAMNHMTKIKFCAECLLDLTNGAHYLALMTRNFKFLLDWFPEEIFETIGAN